MTMHLYETLKLVRHFETWKPVDCHGSKIFYRVLEHWGTKQRVAVFSIFSKSFGFDTVLEQLMHLIWRQWDPKIISTRCWGMISVYWLSSNLMLSFKYHNKSVIITSISNTMQVSTWLFNFFLQNLQLEISELARDISVPLVHWFGCWLPYWVRNHHSCWYPTLTMFWALNPQLLGEKSNTGNTHLQQQYVKWCSMTRRLWGVVTLSSRSRWRCRTSK